MLQGFISCFIYLAVLGTASFFLGRLLPKEMFHADRFPYKCRRREKNGKIYDKLGIRKWQDKVPDMSRLFKKMMPSKKFSELKNDVQKLPLMIQETCVAEFIHRLLFILGFGCVLLWEGIWGWIVTIVYNLLGNVPFILIQRYNRPRLVACEKAAERAGLIQPASNEPEIRKRIKIRPL